MTDAPRPRTGGQILVDQLARHGVGDIFCVPGESFLAVLDARTTPRSASPSAGRRAAPP